MYKKQNKMQKNETIVSASNVVPTDDTFERAIIRQHHLIR